MPRENLQEIRKQLGISLIDEEKVQLSKVVGGGKEVYNMILCLGCVASPLISSCVMFDRKGGDVKNVGMMKLGLRADRYFTNIKNTLLRFLSFSH